MRRSTNMKLIIANGYTYVYSMDEVVDLQEESIIQGILIDYHKVLIRSNPEKAYKVFQVGG